MYNIQCLSVMSTETWPQILKLLAANQTKVFFCAQAKINTALYSCNLNSILNEESRKYSVVLKIIVRHNKLISLKPKLIITDNELHN